MCKCVCMCVYVFFSSGDRKSNEMNRVLFNTQKPKYEISFGYNLTAPIRSKIEKILVICMREFLWIEKFQLPLLPKLY